MAHAPHESLWPMLPHEPLAHEPATDLMPCCLLVPTRSMLSSDFARLAEESQRMIDLGADWLHLDVMVGPAWDSWGRGRTQAGCDVMVVGGLGPGGGGEGGYPWGDHTDSTFLTSPPCLVLVRYPALLTAMLPLPPCCRVVQDGNFVPNLTMGAPIIGCLRKHSTAFFDCHLMVSNPKQWVQVRGLVRGSHGPM